MAERKSPLPTVWKTTLPLLTKRTAISGRESASSVATSATYPASVAGRLRNLRRAGVLKNRSRTTKVVPLGQPASRTSRKRPASTCRRTPAAASSVRVVSSTRETAAMEGSASPRKPKVPMCARSSPERILEVACRSKARRQSSGAMPAPLSVTRR